MSHTTNSNSRAPAASYGIRRPGLAIVLLVLLAAICVSLGFWQFGRANESRALIERIVAAEALPPIGLRTVDEANEGLRYRHVELRGRYVPERQFLIDNMVHQGAAGFYVLTPFAPQDGGPWLIVNRGWVPGDPARRALPDVAVDDAPRSVAGVLDALPSPGLRLGAPAPPSDGPVAVLAFPSIAELEVLLGRSLFHYQLKLDAEQPDGYAREFPPSTLGPERHLAYAVQWWLFGTVAAVAAAGVAWRVMRPRSLV